METRTPRLKQKYNEEISKGLQEKYKYKSTMQVPKLLKIAINQGLGAATQDKKIIDVALDELTRITGQKCVATVSKKDISNFKLRSNTPIGIKGITEQIIFPEIDIDKITRVTGMDITFVTTAKTDAEAYELLKGLGIPFRKA